MIAGGIVKYAGVRYARVSRANDKHARGVCTARNFLAAFIHAEQPSRVASV